MSDNEMVHNILSSEIVKYFQEIFPEFIDLDDEEVVVQQESVYTYIQDNGKNKINWGDYSTEEGESSCGTSVDPQLAFDEALARSLELGEDFYNLYISGHNDTAVESRGSTPAETPLRIVDHNIRDDEIDTDNMTYEELQSLGDAVGHERKGISDDLISRLPCSKYKIGLFSKKREKEECVICCAEYKNGTRLITLPCRHIYHSECIARWLKLSKYCPVCQKEVKDE